MNLGALYILFVKFAGEHHGLIGGICLHCTLDTALIIDPLTPSFGTMVGVIGTVVHAPHRSFHHAMSKQYVARKRFLEGFVTM